MTDDTLMETIRVAVWHHLNEVSDSSDAAYDVAQALIAGGFLQRWQPIGTAPKDGTRVLVAHPAWEAASTAQWYGDFWSVGYSVPQFKHQPTHWQPLPAPPEEKP